MDSFFQSEVFSSTTWSYESMKNFGPINASVQNHLKQVYLTLCLAVAASAAGAYLDILYDVGGITTMIGCLATVVWLLATPPSEQRQRFGLLMAASLFQGAIIGPLIGFAVDFDPRILVTALVGSGLAFGCFSAAALLAKRRQFLFLGGLLGSGLSILLWLQLASSTFGGSTALYNAEIYFGLLLFLGYMVFDTQLMIERALRGDRDHVRDALLLYTDFAGVFVRVLVVTLRNALERGQERRKKKRQSP
ncbi:unnamed protein product [Spirodela intermedia]|uniref:Uncharacterized protein n=1 Tax=Spirodela intermedia TaxID=51605 RepID=A0A7I8L9T3_SPIIN|nr:unnamed protein product [Spirodela intermedia]